ncbi:hypothetical protein [Janthinobacterium fluminis]|uniref:MSHA biogenesis protein MshI n=1 Tax=Janthinobacterium fluminis TaxID=2987524 RepID=A0ABT5K6W8_9BURK|nr:hypothetical protein [Janthinobacterium fluminis]MDC8760395.1 hypothetical protein [Janthinobacterium fluminis]
MSQQINLFNPAFQKQRTFFAAAPMARALAVLLVGALALVFYARQQVAALERDAAQVQSRLAQREARLKTVNVEFAPRQKNRDIEHDLERSEAQLRALEEVAAILQRGELGDTRGYAEYFRAFARQNLGGLWLTGLSISAAGSEIGVQGRAMQAPLIPDYIARLGGEGIMRGKTFGQLEIGRPVAAATDGAARREAPAEAPFVEFSLRSVAGNSGDKAVAK